MVKTYVLNLKSFLEMISLIIVKDLGVSYLSKSHLTQGNREKDDILLNRFHLSVAAASSLIINRTVKSGRTASWEGNYRRKK